MTIKEYFSLKLGDLVVFSKDSGYYREYIGKRGRVSRKPYIDFDRLGVDINNLEDLCNHPSAGDIVYNRASICLVDLLDPPSEHYKTVDVFPEEVEKALDLAEFEWAEIWE